MIFSMLTVGDSCKVRAVNAIGDLIREARARKRWSQSDLARAMKLSPQSVQAWEKEKNSSKPKRSRIEQLSRLLDIPIEDLLQAARYDDLSEQTVGYESGWNRDTEDEFALIPFYDVRAAAGSGATNDHERQVGRLAFRNDWIHARRLSSRQLVAITITGDSMAPALKDGDLVVVDTRETHPVSDGIYILVTDNSLIAKRVQLAATGGIWLHSDNPAYQDQLIPASDTDRVRFVGRVVWAGGEL